MPDLYRTRSIFLASRRGEDLIQGRGEREVSAQARGQSWVRTYTHTHGLTSSSRSATHLMDVKYSLRCLWLKAECEVPG